MNFSEYQNKTSSEKIVLATLDASKRLMGWSVYSGSVYQLENISYKVIVSIEDSGTAYVEAANVGAVTAGKYFLDRDTNTLYLRTTGSDNPNSRFIAATFRFFFSNLPIALPHDLDSEFEVFWEPLIQSSSEFGVEIDTINQTSEAIEGSGSLTLINDFNFWPQNFDKLIFENKACSIYSYNRELDVSEAQLLFKGKVEKRSYKAGSISFTLKDMLSELKVPVAMSLIEDLALRNSPALNKAFQRMILGRVYGYRPTNVDEVKDGYPITGTVSVTNTSATLTGSGTTFLAQLSRDDKLVIEGVEYTIASIASDTSLTLTENYTGLTASGITIYVIPDQPKRWINREWVVAGHALCQPTTTISASSTTSRLFVASTEGMRDGDYIYVGTLGSGELVTIDSVISSNMIKLATSLLNSPAIGTTVIRPAVQFVRINDLELLFYRDYTIDATNGTMTLRDTAEANAAPIRKMVSNLTFSNGSRNVTGTGLDAIFKPGYVVSCVGHVDFFEVMDVTETQLTLRTAANFNDTAIGLYRSVVFGSDDILSCDVLGRTDDGTSSGSLITSGPDMVRHLLIDAGLEDDLDSDSFDDSSAIASQHIGYVIPKEYQETKAPTYRDAINTINKSIFGNLIQTEAFLLSYFVIQPRKSSANLKLREADILDFKVENNAQNMIKTAIVEYRKKEYDYLIEEDSMLTEQKTSNPSTYLLKTDKTKTFSTVLVDQKDARILANRLAFILEHTAGLITIKTKLQAAKTEVGHVIDIEHRKLFVRHGGNESRRLVLVQKVGQDGKFVSIEAVDLSNAFNRCANITENSHPDFSDSTSDELIIGGYITDNYGMQDNEPDTFGINLIW